MSAPASHPLHQPDRFGRLWWLPEGGKGNGLSDSGWAPLADIDPRLVRPLLAALRSAGVPAYAAPVTRRPLPSRARRRWRLWVGTSRYSLAEEILRIRLPALLRHSRG
jgi:hypothetical protein